MNLDLKYRSTQGVELRVRVSAPVAVLAEDAEHLTPREAQDVINMATKRALPRLAPLFVAILEQIDEALHASYIESLRHHARENKPDLHTDLAPAGKGEA